MSPEATFLFLLVAFVCFVCDAVLHAFQVAHTRLALISIGLASWVLVALWTAFKAL